MEHKSQKSYVTTYWLRAFLGIFGAHRFYVGRWITGIIWLLTLGCLFIGSFVDWFLISLGKFKYSNKNYVRHNQGSSNHSYSKVFLLFAFFGGLGLHRFAVGKIGTGILWALTGGLFGIGNLVDKYMIVFGKFKDKSGHKITQWNY